MNSVLKGETAVADVEDLISAFDAQQPTDVRGQEYGGKIEIVKKVERSDDVRVLPFLLRVATDEHEYDLARMEVLTDLRLRTYANDDDRLTVGRAVMHVLLNDPDDDVRNYAAIAMRRFMDVPGALASVQQVLDNQDEEVVLRSSAFASMQRLGPTDQTIDIMRALIADSEFAKSASRILSEWGVA